MLDSEIKNRLSFVRADDISSVPDCPGVYAWYLPLVGRDSGSFFDYLDDLKKNLASWDAAKIIETNGRQKTFTIAPFRPEFNKESKELVALNEEVNSVQLQSISRLIYLLSFLSEPFYIGKTDRGLKGRLKDHLADVKLFEDDNWNGSLRSRIAKIDPQMMRQCLIVYICLDNYGENKIARLIEHVLIKIIQPSQSRRD